MRRRRTSTAADWVTDDVRAEAELVLAERLKWARSLGYSELVRHGAHELACEVLGPRTPRKYAHETNVLGDSPVHVTVEVYAYDGKHGWSDALAGGVLLVNEDGTITE
jgi:hypothetical protein